MRIASWNIHGLGQPPTVYRLNNKLREISPQVLFLMETKLSTRRMENVRRKCGFVHGLDVDAVGSKGGLSLSWKQDCSVSLRSYSQNLMDVDIHEIQSRLTWHRVLWSP